MPTYKYIGKNRRGQRKKGTIESRSKNQAVQMLREMNLMPIEIVETQPSIWKQDITIGNPVKSQDFVIYCRQFATLIRAGITIIDATRILAKQTESKALKKVLQQMDEDLQKGTAISAAVEKHRKVFPSMFVNMMKAGEASGNLDETLDRLATYFEKQFQLKKKIQSAMSYPIAIGLVTVGVVMFLLASVVPTFVDMFAQFDAQLPAITVFVLDASDFVQAYWWLLILVIALIVIGIILLQKRDERVSYWIGYISLKTPLFGKLLQKAAVARMTRTLSSLFASSVPILQALTIVEKVVDHPVLGKVIFEARDSLEKGNSLAQPLEDSWVFPPLVSQMVQIGEETGSLDLMLAKVADFYEDEVERSVDSLKSLIEPLMIVLLAGIVGTIVLAIMLPMFEIFNAF
ncbi:type II secretion system F family protein [Desertibacillus haloalkaliphilus]|uniref:type II secretion system F family protein n=1 Tax=Desertibacillus haloalkaliphilus TaxID=1328930 RepID=UPI001C263DC5|nr:type II secretion system F family protein [Desertibacillus haloalkaliphilus]MBU8905049.1 type II secretion system F family protein [Desertibacillus haloalkaliphilus]